MRQHKHQQRRITSGLLRFRHSDHVVWEPRMRQVLGVDVLTVDNVRELFAVDDLFVHIHIHGRLKHVLMAHGVVASNRGNGTAPITRAYDRDPLLLLNHGTSKDLRQYGGGQEFTWITLPASVCLRFGAARLAKKALRALRPTCWWLVSLGISNQTSSVSLATWTEEADSPRNERAGRVRQVGWRRRGAVNGAPGAPVPRPTLAAPVRLCGVVARWRTRS